MKITHIPIVQYGVNHILSALVRVLYAMRFPSFSSKVHRSILSLPDYFRYSTIGLALQRVLSENVEGSLAEVGVYQGEMSRFIHEIIPNRNLFLFDTFEGFPQTDLEPGSANDKRFRNTSVDVVLSKMKRIDNVIIRKGYVPDTFKGLEHEKFAFVLIDLDLYKPTVSSLEFFYSRISPGGYIFVHDYNSPESNWACKRAVDEFLKNRQERLTEIGDRWGTAVFRKM